jgi:hypothetical protein
MLLEVRSAASLPVWRAALTRWVFVAGATVADVNARIAGAGTLLPMYQSSRFFPAATSFPQPMYSIPWAEGTWNLALYFANTYSGTGTVGSRVFDIIVNGASVVQNFDIIAAAGGDLTATRLLIPNITVMGKGRIDLSFRGVKENPMLCGLEVLDLTTPPPTMEPTTGPTTPSAAPTAAPSAAPSAAPITRTPTQEPTVATDAPTQAPTVATAAPTEMSAAPSDAPTDLPTDMATDFPTAAPTEFAGGPAPTEQPSPDSTPAPPATEPTSGGHLRPAAAARASVCSSDSLPRCTEPTTAEPTSEPTSASVCGDGILQIGEWCDLIGDIGCFAVRAALPLELGLSRRPRLRAAPRAVQAAAQLRLHQRDVLPDPLGCPRLATVCAV